MAEPDAVGGLADATPRATPSPVDRVWLALPFVLLLAGLVATVVSSGLPSTDTGLAVGLAVALVEPAPTPARLRTR